MWFTNETASRYDACCSWNTPCVSRNIIYCIEPATYSLRHITWHVCWAWYLRLCPCISRAESTQSKLLRSVTEWDPGQAPHSLHVVSLQRPGLKWSSCSIETVKYKHWYSCRARQSSPKLTFLGNWYNNWYMQNMSKPFVRDLVCWISATKSLVRASRTACTSPKRNGWRCWAATHFGFGESPEKHKK